MKIPTFSRIKIYNSPQRFIFSIYTFSTTAHVICFSRVDAQKDRRYRHRWYCTSRFKYILIVPNRFIYNDEKRRRILRISRRTSDDD